MNKIILIFAILLFSTGTYAASCDNKTLEGTFGYEVNGVNEFPIPTSSPPTSPPTFKNVTRSTHVVGKAQFDADNDTVEIIGKGTAAGVLEAKTAHGTYEVDPETCIATGTILWDLPADALPGTPQESSTFYIVMDHTDSSNKYPNRAYHANVVVTGKTETALGKYTSSASGTLTRFVGKFH